MEFVQSIETNPEGEISLTIADIADYAVEDELSEMHPYRKFQINQIYRELLDICGLNPFDRFDSSSRKQMMASHIGQSLPIMGATERRIQTGMEREFGKYTMSVRMPDDGVVLRTVDKYKQKQGDNSVTFNPSTTMFFERDSDKEIGVLEFPRYCSQHQYFGFDYVPTENYSRVRHGESFRKGDVFLDSTSKTSNGGYKYGIELNVANMTIPGVSEDGIVVRRGILKQLRYKTYESRIVSFGSKRFPLNIYGMIEGYKSFPDIGDYVRPDGLLMALREYRVDLSPVKQSIYDVMEPDYQYDKLVYADGPGGRVIDITVWYGGQNLGNILDGNFDAQLLKYARASREYYGSVLDEYQRLQRLRGKSLQISNEFQQLVRRAMAVVGVRGPNGSLDFPQLMHKRAPIDEWRVEFVIEYVKTPDVGHKLTDVHGCKGVICAIMEDDDMPVDADGNRADVIMDPNARSSRMNTGGLNEQYLNSVTRDAVKRAAAGLGVQVGDSRAFAKLSQLEQDDPALVQKWWNYMMGCYLLAAPRTYAEMQRYPATKATHLTSLVRSGAYLYYPPDTQHVGMDGKPVRKVTQEEYDAAMEEFEADDVEPMPVGSEVQYEFTDAVMDLERYYPPTYGPVTYRDLNGDLVTTLENVRIGSAYFILLEKTSDSWSAVSSAKRQHFGVPSHVGSVDKYAHPAKPQPTRAGEAEWRIFVSYLAPLVAANFLDRSNNLLAHRAVCDSILTAEFPTNIPVAVDRNKIPLGNGRPHQLVNNINLCAGFKFAYKPGYSIPKTYTNY